MLEFNELTEQIFGLRVGIHWQGGIVVYVDESGKHGLIAAESGFGFYKQDGAIEICKEYRGGGFDDWRLPTKDELNLLYLARKIGIGGFVYWSSSEYSASYAWYHNFNNGIQRYLNKYNNFYVRAVRSF